MIILNNDKYGIGDKKWKHEQLTIKWKKYNNDDQITDDVIIDQDDNDFNMTTINPVLMEWKSMMKLKFLDETLISN